MCEGNGASSQDLKHDEDPFDLAEALPLDFFAAIDPTQNDRPHGHPHQTEQERAEHRLGEVEVEVQVLEALEEGDEADDEEDEKEEEGADLACLFHGIVGVEDRDASELEDPERQDPRKQRRGEPTHHDLGHLAPVDGVGADRDGAEPHDRTHDRVRRGYGEPQSRRAQ